LVNPDRPRGKAHLSPPPSASKTHNGEISPGGVAGSESRGVPYQSLPRVNIDIKCYCVPIQKVSK